MSDDSHDPPRRQPRVDTEIPARISTIEPDSDPVTGRSYFRASHELASNVSRGGAFIRTTELLERGRRVLVELSLPTGEHVEAVGRVAWTQRVLTPGGGLPECGVGVEFLGGESDQLSRLDDFVRKGADDSTDH
ncbi:MAG: PilZ domain-containing protein [Myxococcota bacterium]